jgi:hypothetical protein
MLRHKLTLLLMPGLHAVSRLASDDPLPTWAAGEFLSVTRTADELSVVCREEAVPQGVQCERGWRCLRVAGTLEFALVGILASLLVPLAEAGVSVFAASTFDTDYILVPQMALVQAIAALRAAGHVVQGES